MKRKHRRCYTHCPRVRALGRDFQAWRASYDAQEESASYGYAVERAEWRSQHRPPTFRTYLVQMTGSGWPMSGGMA
jgi:hypothetical protein